MDQNLLIIIAVFVFVAAAALCIQAGFLFGIYKATRKLEERTLPLLPKVEALVESSRTVVDNSRVQIQEITVKTNEILDATRRQLARVDEVMEDAVARAHIQLDHAEMVVDDSINRAQETVTLVHNGIMMPLREIQGVAAGLRAGLRYLMRGRNNGPVHATADEEMFI